MTKCEIIEKEMPIIITQLAVGLHEEEQALRQNAESFPDSDLLRSGMNAFFAIRFKYGEICDLSDCDKKSFFENYLLHPICDWFDNWPRDVVDAMKEIDVYFLNLDALARRDALTEYAPTTECEDLLDLSERDMVRGLEQRMVYDELMYTDQESYVDIRAFIIRNPHVSMFQLKAKRNSYHAREMKAAVNALNYAYNYDETRDEMVARDGVMKYMVKPGIFEMELADYCNSQGIENELWPNMDLWDLGITFDDGECWMIDVKAYTRPYSLVAKLEHDQGLPKGDYDKGFLVIPDEFVKQFTAYCKIVNRRCFSSDNRQECVSMRTIKQRIREKKENAV